MLLYTFTVCFFRFGDYSWGHSLQIVVYVPAWFCSDWRYRNYNRQRLGLHASLWTDGACSGLSVSASGYVAL